MTSIETPRPIVALLDATNAADSDAFVAAFTDDAFLNDWGRQYRGHEGVRDWDRTDNIGVQSRVALTALKPGPGPGPDTFVGTVLVSGNRFNGTGTMTFTLRDDRIASLVIS